ncbi:MAG: HAD family phosphatase [Anaerolineae bacterium]|nr:HAD family phosphatase [Anaerolineae bacterium]
MARESASARRMLILDFDGVLVDTEPVHFESWNQAFRERFDLWLEGDYRQIVGLTLAELYQLWTGGCAGKLVELDAPLKAELLARKTELFFSLGVDRLTPMPGSIDLLRAAHATGWYTAIASRAKRLRLMQTLDLVQMPALFDVILGLEDVVDPATNRKIHARAAVLFGIDPAQCIVVEDSPSGVTTAVACGIGRVIGFAHAIEPDALLAAGAHEIVTQLSDVKL